MNVSADEPVTMALVRALVGEAAQQIRGESAVAIAALGGRIDVLAEAQRGAAEQQRLAAELSSREHAAVHSSLVELGHKVDGVATRLEAVERDDVRDDAREETDSRWRRRFWAVVVLAVPTTIALGTFTVERLTA